MQRTPYVNSQCSWMCFFVMTASWIISVDVSSSVTMAGFESLLEGPSIVLGCLACGHGHFVASMLPETC